MRNLNECKESDSNNNFRKSEENKSFVLRSDLNFYCEIVYIEKCVLKDEMIGGEMIKKCDWLFLVPKKENTHLKKAFAYYIELKGVNIKDACEQLYNSIDRTKHQISNFEIEARVISTVGKQPEILNNEYYRKVKRIIKKDIKFCKVHKGNKFTHVETI